jgi:hypothetical protein
MPVISEYGGGGFAILVFFRIMKVFIECWIRHYLVYPLNAFMGLCVETKSGSSLGGELISSFLVDLPSIVNPLSMI